jgi:hypothetical protein
MVRSRLENTDSVWFVLWIVFFLGLTSMCIVFCHHRVVLRIKAGVRGMDLCIFTSAYKQGLLCSGASYFSVISLSKKGFGGQGVGRALQFSIRHIHAIECTTNHCFWPSQHRTHALEMVAVLFRTSLLFE